MHDTDPAGNSIAVEWAALRTAAGLVARGASPRVVLETAARHVAAAVRADFLEILHFERGDRTVAVGAWAAAGERVVDLHSWLLEDDSVARRIERTRAPARENKHLSRGKGKSEIPRERFAITSSVGVPIMLGEQVWGAMFVHSAGEDLPVDTEARLSGFTELIASVLANARAHDEIEALADDQSAMLRVAELVARGVMPDDVFGAVAEELGRILRVAGAKMLRYDDDDMVTFVASWGSLEAGIPAGLRLSSRGTSVTGRIRTSGKPARVEDYGAVEGEIGALQRSFGMRSAVGAPINVNGKIWGALVVGSVEARPLPPDTEERMAKFADLVAVALSNLESRVSLQALADEQAALRRVATVVAREEWDVTLPTIVQEVVVLHQVDGAVLLRYEDEETATILAAWGAPELPQFVAQRMSFTGDNPAAYVWDTHAPARQYGWEGCEGVFAQLSRDAGVTGSVAIPVIVENRLWGAIVVVSMDPGPLPAETEHRVGQFAELVATAIGNMKSRLELIESRARIVHTADQTRRRFERDLHDGIQQRLVSILLEVRSIEAGGRERLPAVHARLSRVSSELETALEDLRELSRGIHPSILSEGGLGPALRSLARSSSLPTRLEMDPLPRLPEPVEVATYFVISEALTNAVKHANAAMVTITVRSVDNEIHILVVDDGDGGADMTKGSGLVGLEDRVAALGGTLSVSSPASLGTKISARLPAIQR